MGLRQLKSDVILNAKNLVGWKTKRKIIIFSVDDYGNVRVDSRKAREQMNRAGLKITSRFDAYDALETTEDLEALYDTLSSVKDKHGRHAVFTPFAVPCNINFEKITTNRYQQYCYELLPETFAKLKGYERTWPLWQEGIRNGLMVPQFHGREHLNLKVFNFLLEERNSELITCLKNRSYTSISKKPFPNIEYTAAFEFEDVRENQALQTIIEDGLQCFQKVFGFKAEHFMPPTSKIHRSNYPQLRDCGIKYVDIALFQHQHQGNNRYRTTYNFTGKRNSVGQTFLVRNVVFEPTDNRGVDWVSYAIQQIEAAFRWNRPAIISSHRVNYCGRIEEKNRAQGIEVLRSLLKKIVEKWPDVEFLSANKLGEEVAI